jgi:Immunity protein 51
MTELNIFRDPAGDYCLTIMDADDRTQDLFDERGLQGGGYTWQSIVEALIRMNAPELLSRLRIFDAEADNMYAYCDDREVLERIAAIVRSAIADHDQLIAAIDHAGEDLQ